MGPIDRTQLEEREHRFDITVVELVGLELVERILPLLFLIKRQYFSAVRLNYFQAN